MISCCCLEMIYLVNFFNNYHLGGLVAHSDGAFHPLKPEKFELLLRFTILVDLPSVIFEW